jgi:hypothetical protein
MGDTDRPAFLVGRPQEDQAMLRAAPLCGLVIVALSVVGVLRWKNGLPCCSGTANPDCQEAGIWAGNIQEPDGPGEPIQKASHWRAVGQDRTGCHWEGYLVVESAPEGYMSAGSFWWGAEPAAGRYHFKGTFDPQTRRVRWTGYSIEDRAGRPAMATYEALLTPDGRQLSGGTWSGGISIPGTWSAEYLGEW